VLVSELPDEPPAVDAAGAVVMAGIEPKPVWPDGEPHDPTKATRLSRREY